MAVITLDAILSILGGGKLISGLSTASNWSGWISGDGPNRKVTVSTVSFEEIALELTVVDGATTYDLKAVPKDAEHTEVLVNGTLVPGAALVFQPKFSIGDLHRYAFDFRPITVNGKAARFNMRYDP